MRLLALIRYKMYHYNITLFTRTGCVGMSVIHRLPMRAMLMWLFFFSLTDAVFTDIGIRLNLITEMNPFVSWLYDWHFAAYYGIKLILPLLFLLLFPQLKSRQWMHFSAVVLFLLYLFVNLYHLLWVTLALIQAH
jgi:hypothetical protein